MATARLALGERLVALQNDLAEIEQRLGEGESAAAGRLLEAVAADLARLRGAVSTAIANDPNLLVLEAQLDGLRQRLK